MKFCKRSIIALLIIIFVVSLTGCDDGGETVKVFDGFFNNYTSATDFTKATNTLELASGVKVASYDINNEVFITCQDLMEDYYDNLDDLNGDTEGDTEEEVEEAYLFGFASKDEELIPPSYLTVIAIQGDYAIVVKPYFPSVDATFDDMEMRIGVIKFRGDNRGDRTDFEAVYNSTATQIRFVDDDYIVIANDKDNINITSDTFTFYDYKSTHKLLELFRIKADAGYTFMSCDNTIVSITTAKAEFYNKNLINDNGYLILSDTYTPFPEDKDGTLDEYITTMVSYLGNNWFLRQGYILADEDDFSEEDMEAIDGQFILIESVDSSTGLTVTNNMLMRSDRYNSSSKVMLTNGILVPDMVANGYNLKSTRDIADYMNNTLELGANDKIAYYPPSMPVGALAKEGMSLVYYYYFPYADEPNRYVMSFCMMDSNGNIYHLEENIIMPLMFIDGKGVQITDPDYDMAYGNAGFVDMDNNISSFKEYSYDNYGYTNIAYNNGILIVAEYKLSDSSTDMYYGAFNSEGKQITYFKYLELSIFYENYAIGMNKVNDEYRYYRIDKSGNETRLFDVYAIRNGVYVTLSGGKTGLKSYDGTVLIPNEYDSIDVYETFLIDGKFQKSIVSAVKDGKGYIFTLE